MWLKLSEMSQDECENAAQLFKSGCLTLGLDGALIDELCLVLSAYPPSSVYANITPKPTSEGFRTVLHNVKDFLEDGVYESCLALLPQGATPAKALDSRISVKSNTYEFVLLTLIDVMAGCSKIGGGTEDSIAIISGAPNLATLLFQDSFFNRIGVILSKLHKRQESSYFQFMVPLMFAHAVLLQKNSRSPKSIRLPNTLEDFREIQDQHFGGCLTEASLQSRRAYLNLLSSEAYQEDPWLAQDVSIELELKLLAMSDEVKQVIEHRIKLANEDHRELSEHLHVAIRWLDTPYSLVYQSAQSDSSSSSPTLSDRYTPISDSYPSLSTDTYSFFTIVPKASSTDSVDSILTQGR